MNSVKGVLFGLFFCVVTTASFAQDADSKVKALLDKYAAIPNYKVNVTYEAANENMGFSNTQNGVLVVQGDKYILKYGPNETWLSDGKTEYVGTKEPDHSQIIFFCAGQNGEAIVDFGAMMTFYGSDHSATLEGSTLKLTPNGAKNYKEIHIESNGNDITSITALDAFGTAHKYSFSNFSTNTSGIRFEINPAQYEEKIYENKDCK